MRSLNELFARAADYREYKAISNKSEYEDLRRHVPRFRKRLTSKWGRGIPLVAAQSQS